MKVGCPKSVHSKVPKSPKAKAAKAYPHKLSKLPKKVAKPAKKPGTLQPGVSVGRVLAIEVQTPWLVNLKNRLWLRHSQEAALDLRFEPTMDVSQRFGSTMDLRECVGS